LHRLGVIEGIRRCFNRVSRTWAELTGQWIPLLLFAMTAGSTIVPMSALASGNGKAQDTDIASITPVLNLLLANTPLAIPFSWNGEMLTEQTVLSSSANTVNVLRVDLRNVPGAYVAGLREVRLGADGGCFKMRGATADPAVYEWDVITGTSGVCKLNLQIDTQLNGELKTLSSSLNFPVSAESGTPVLLGLTEGQPLDLIFDIENMRRIASGYQGAQTGGSLLPQAYEFRATAPGGEQLNGVMYGLLRFDPAEAALSDDFSAAVNQQQLRLKATLKRIHGKFVLAGVAMPEFGTSPTPRQLAFQRIAWTFLAVPRDTVFSGPEAGRVFHYYGPISLNGICAGNIMASQFKVDNPAKRARVAGVLLAKVPDAANCNGVSFNAQAKASMDARVISTQIGPLLTSQGFLAPDGAFSNGLPAFGLAIAEEIQGTGDIADVELKPQARMMDLVAAEAFLGFNLPNQALVFSSLQGSLAGLTVGDYIASRPHPKAPNGFLRKVTQLQTVNGYTVMGTAVATISDIMQRADVHVKRSYVLADVEEANTWYGVPAVAPALKQAVASNTLSILSASPDQSGFTVSALGKNANDGDLINIKVNKVVFDQDGDHGTTDDQIKVTGNLSFNPSVQLDLDCAGFLCTSPDFLAKFVLSEESSVEVSGSIKQTLTKTYKLPPTIWLPFISVGPLVFTPKFVVQLNVDGSVSASVRYGASQSFELEAGVDYTPAAGWGTISELSTSSESSEPVYQGDMNLKAELSVRGEFMLYGAAGVYADMGGTARFKAQIPGAPIWKLRGGFEASVGVALDVLVWNASFEEDLLKESWLILEAQNIEPDPPYVSPPYPISFGAVEKDGDILFDISSFDPEQGENCCLVELHSNLDGLMVKAQTALQTTFPYVFKTEGSHTITATVTDNEGLENTSSMLVDVQDSLIVVRAPETSLNLPSAVSAGSFANLEVSFVDQLSRGANLDCCDVEWQIDGALVGRTYSYNGDPMHHIFPYRFEWPASPGAQATIDGKLDVEVKMIASYDVVNDGLPPSYVERSALVSIVRDAPEIRNELSPMLKSFPQGHTPPYVGDEVIYTTSLSAPASCNQVKWYSSIESDGAPGTDGFVGFGTISNGVARLSKTFSTADIRTITASISDANCVKSSAQEKTKVIDPWLGGGSPAPLGSFNL